MKKLSFVFIITFFTILSIQDTKAQANWEVGMRFGDDISAEGTIPLGIAPRFHPAIYMVDRFGIGGYFDWMFALNNGPEGLKFYPGIGPELFFEYDFAFHFAGNFGVEYSFDFPFTIGFDWRPGFAVTEGFDFKASNWGFSARFRFGEGVKFQRAN